MKLFEQFEPQQPAVPIVISIPHAGTHFPAEIKKHYNKRLRQIADDTDWFLDQLYDFAPKLGITIIKANVSRWVVDLNRDPDSAPLYRDGRLLTTCTPTTDFFGNKLYKSIDLEPDKKEKKRRLKTYYWPYYEQLKLLLAERKSEFGRVLLWDAHSIRHRVGTIQRAVFPDFILGNNDGQTAGRSLIDAALMQLRASEFDVHHNHPFKGGHISRYFGKPDENIHALQLEMNKILYMDDNELTYNEQRAEQIKETVLMPIFKELIKQVSIR